MESKTPPSIQLDYLRLDNHFKEIEENFNKTKAFIDRSKKTVEDNMSKFTKFVSESKGSNLVIGNMYSSYNNEHNDNNRMIAHCTLKVQKNPNPVYYRRLTDILEKKWLEIFGDTIIAEFQSYKIKENKVEFKIWI